MTGHPGGGAQKGGQKGAGGLPGTVTRRRQYDWSLAVSVCVRTIIIIYVNGLTDYYSHDMHPYRGQTTRP